MPMYWVKCEKCGGEEEVLSHEYHATGDVVGKCEICGGDTRKVGVDLCARTPKAWAGYLMSDM